MERIYLKSVPAYVKLTIMREPYHKDINNKHKYADDYIVKPAYDSPAI